MVKIKWKVSDVLTGRYSSFEKRSWPVAHYETGDIAAMIHCKNSYHPADVKTGNHDLLELWVANHFKKPWIWVKSKNKYKTLAEAKKALLLILKKYTYLVPKKG